MELFDIVILALIQGITEFLPISSSGHLALWPLLTGRADQGPAMDAAVHVGTLVAVCWFFRAEVGRLFVGSGHILTGRVRTADARMVWLLALATVPAMAFGLVLKATDSQAMLRTVELIGWTTLIGAALLWLADLTVTRRGRAEGWDLRDAVLMGLAQAVALIPGVSRSGITMTMARFLGFDRVQAARLALLMAVPVIIAAGSVEILGVVREGDVRLGADLVLGAVLSCVAALVALNVMMRMFVATWTMLPFVLYRLALGAVLLALAYGVIALPGAAPA
jgi:undecaprenyl-diphosphatase